MNAPTDRAHNLDGFVQTTNKTCNPATELISLKIVLQTYNFHKPTSSAYWIKTLSGGSGTILEECNGEICVGTGNGSLWIARMARAKGVKIRAGEALRWED